MRGGRAGPGGAACAAPSAAPAPAPGPAGCGAGGGLGEQGRSAWQRSAGRGRTQATEARRLRGSASLDALLAAGLLQAPAWNYLPGRGWGCGSRTAALGDRARLPARRGLRARPRAPAGHARSAGPRGRRLARAPRSAGSARTRRPAHVRPPRPAQRRMPRLPIGRAGVTRRQAPPLVSHSRRRRRQGLVSAGDWRRRRRLELEPQRLRAVRAGRRGVGRRRLPGRRFSAEARRVRLRGGGPACP